MQMNESKALALAACIRRAHEGPVEDGVERLSPEHDYYWHTRERVMEIAGQLGIFRPTILHLYEQETKSMLPGLLAEYSKPFWYDVQHPDLLAADVMQS